MRDEPVMTAPEVHSAMPLDAQIRHRIDALIDRVSADLALQLRGLADELVSATAADQSDAVQLAVRAAEEQAERRVSEAEADARLAVEGAREDLRVATEASATERAARAGERDAMLAGFERLLVHLRHIDASESLRGVLDAFAEGLTEAGARSLFLVRRGDVFRGWRFSGFGEQAPDAWAVSLPADAMGPLASVIESREARELHPDVFGTAALRDLAFAGLSHDRAGLAVPVCIGNVTIAIAYVDDGGVVDRIVPGPWPEVVQILARHTSRRLEALTTRRAVAFGLVPRAASDSSAPTTPPEEEGVSEPRAIEAAARYARLLVSEIRLYNEGTIRQGRQQRDLRRRLRSEIDRARRMYEERVPSSLPGRHEYFERELLRTLADGDPDALGSD